MKNIWTTVALATVTAVSAGAARAEIIPFDGVSPSDVVSGPNVTGAGTAYNEEVATPDFIDFRQDDGPKKAVALLPGAGAVGGAILIGEMLNNGDSYVFLQRTAGPATNPISIVPLGAPMDPPAVAPVPELSTSLLVVIGLALLTLAGWRRNQASLEGQRLVKVAVARAAAV